MYVKKYFYTGLSIVLILSLGIIAYGTYLNFRGENIIAARMDNRHVSLKGQTVQKRNIEPVLTLPTIKLYSDEMADAVALIDGRITDSYVKRNSFVKEGDLMFSLINEEIPLKISQADSEIAKAQVELKRAKNTYNRYSKLIQQNAVSAEKFDEVEAAYNAAIVSLENLQTQKKQMLVQESRQEITAPINGEVLLLYRQPGSYVTAGTAIALVGDFSHMSFSQTMNDSEVNKLSLGEELQVMFQSHDLEKVYDTDYASGNNGENQVFTARIMDIMPTLDKPAAMRKVVFEIDNSVGMLEPKSYHNVNLQVQQSIFCLSVPLSAMLTQEHNSVFVLTADNTIQRRNIVTGVDDGTYIEVIEGLSEGDIVITSDTDGLKDGIKVDITMEEG